MQPLALSLPTLLALQADAALSPTGAAPAALAGIDAVLGRRSRPPHMPLINKPALAAGLPALCAFKISVLRSGCALSRGMAFAGFGSIAARQIDRICKGMPPGNLPMAYPTQHERILPAGRLQALGLKLLQALRLRADEVMA